jgi:tellurite resistance protein
MMVLDRSMGPDRDALSIRQALSEVETLSTERRRFLAGYAYILVRLARADDELNEAETASIEAAVVEAGDLSEQQGALLVAVASGMSSLYGSTEDFAITRDFARTSSPQERQRLLRACVTVALADGSIVGAESTELHEIGHELGFEADEIGAVREQIDHQPDEGIPPPS